MTKLMTQSEIAESLNRLKGIKTVEQKNDWKSFGEARRSGHSAFQKSATASDADHALLKSAGGPPRQDLVDNAVAAHKDAAKSHAIAKSLLDPDESGNMRDIHQKSENYHTKVVGYFE